MNRKNLIGVCVLPFLLFVFWLGRRHWMHSPPYEVGVHNLVVEAQTNATTRGPRVGPCPIFPQDNVWNTPIDKLPKSDKSDAYLASIGPEAKVHPDFASVLNSGIPYTEISTKTPKVRISFLYHDDSDLGNYPIPHDPPIEGGSNSTGDRHIILIDTTRCLLYEIFDAHPGVDGVWTAGSGIKMDLTGNALRPSGLGSADAAGLPIFPGLVRYEEVEAGQINHALRFTTKHTQRAFVWPARHFASREKDTDVPPMGIRLRLRADFDISHFSRTDQVILRALKRYGMILADNGGSLFISGVSDKRWDDSDLHKLGAVTTKDFEVVDESDLQLLADSARVDPVSVPR
ncbi:MAG: hypothetical protein V4555_03995 [Acidobacteriota bacterium]